MVYLYTYACVIAVNVLWLLIKKELNYKRPKRDRIITKYNNTLYKTTHRAGKTFPWFANTENKRSVYTASIIIIL